MPDVRFIDLQSCISTHIYVVINVYPCHSSVKKQFNMKIVHLINYKLDFCPETFAQQQRQPHDHRRKV